MALHAQVHAQRGCQPSRIQNARADVARLGGGVLSGGNMPRPRPVATLAIDTLRQIAGKHRVAARRVMASRNLLIRVVTENALVGDEAPRLWMGGIESRAHAPISALFRIPAERQYDIFAAGTAVQIRARV